MEDRILLTGAGPKSFIGRWLKQALKKNYAVFAPTHSELELLDYEALERYVAENKIQSIVHAAVHVPIFNGEANEYFNDMKMFMNIEKVGRALDRFVYFGSGAEYDKQFDITFAKEEQALQRIPQSEYGFAKYTMNRIASRSKNIFNLRLFGIFGPYELWQYKFISNICCKAIFNLPITIRQDCNFDFLYIEDLFPVVEWVLEKSPEHNDYNVCSGVSYRLTEIAQMVMAISGAESEIVVFKDGMDKDYTGDNSRLKEEMKNWKTTPLYEAIEKLYAFYYDNRDSIDRGILEQSR